MSAKYMHVGIPVLNKKPNMIYADWGKFWVNESVDAYDFKIEYLKFDEGTICPWTSWKATSSRPSRSSSGPSRWGTARTVWPS